jgi:glycosyltransferase involved in cell wall biosynthesis
MKMSIIIPTIRSEKMIDFQLPSFAKQTFPREEFEIIIIDDCSIDRRGQIEEFGRASNTNIKWMQSKKPYYRSNANIGCARNTGLIYAKGELIVFIDDFSVVRHKYLESVWSVYNQDRSFSHIGPVISVEYQENPPENINELKIRHTDPRSTKGKSSRIGHKLRECKSEWTYTSNVSVPIKDIIKINGFWEIADLTREEDVLMGLALGRIGRKFCFVNSIDISAYHMTHDSYNTERKYKDITFRELGWEDTVIKGRTVVGYGGQGKNGLKTNSDEIQRVTKDIFGTKNPGSWALIEVFKRDKNLVFNKDIGFNLAEERKKIGNWT